jgi:predicted anti-sigma-YlaC factor YlaD
LGFRKAIAAAQKERERTVNMRIEPMTRSAFRFMRHSGAVDALLVMAHPEHYSGPPSQLIPALDCIRADDWLSLLSQRHGRQAMSWAGSKMVMYRESVIQRGGPSSGRPQRRPERTLLRSSVLAWGFLLLWLIGSGCSVRRYATRQIADILSTSGTTFAGDEDPELVKAAVPFSLKLIESVLRETPQHRGLLLAAASGFTEYAFAFVQEDADELEARDLAGAEALRGRARRLYLRAQNYGFRGLETAHPGFRKALLANPHAAVKLAAKSDVPLLYWTAAAWASAISLSKDNPELVGQIPAMEALIDRALELDEAFDSGAIHSFLITYELSRQGGQGEPAARARKHFDRAMELAHGQQAGPLVALAEAVDVKQQNVKEFESLLSRALAIDPHRDPNTTLVNLVLQRRAQWLLSRKSELFLIE